MNNTLLFLRHGRTGPTYDSRDPKKILPISEWLLTDKGQKQAEDAAKIAELQDVDLIVISTEKKAWDTVQPLIEHLKKAGKKFEVVQSEHIAELNRDAGGHMESDVYEQAAKEAITNRDVSVHNWEKANDALARFTKGVGMIDAEYSNKKILFIGHGYTFGMYFAQQEGTLDKRKLYERIHEVPYGGWGMIKDGKVLRSLLPKMEEQPGEPMV